MPLSEHEQKLLEQMERALYAEDPKFASQMKGRGHGPSRKRLFIGLAIALVGLLCIVAGVSFELIWLGGVGFAVMVAGVAWAFGARGHGPELTDTSTGRSRRVGRPRGSRKKDKRAGGSTGFMQRMEDRWDERKRGDSL